MISVVPDFREFDAAMRDYLKATSRTADEAILRKAADLSFASAANTIKANAAQIRHDLGAITETRISKKGKMSFKTSFDSFDNTKSGINAAATLSRAAKIVNKNRSPKMWGKQLADAAFKLINQRVGRIAFVKYSWITSGKGVSNIAASKGISIPVKSDGEKKRKKEKGRAMFASPFFGASEVIIFNEATQQKSSGGLKYAAAGLARALPAVVADMRNYLTRKMQETSNKFNAK